MTQSSVDCFIRLTHQRYYDWLEGYFGNTVIGFFTDEPDLLGRIGNPKCHAWTWGFEDIVTKHGGRLYVGENSYEYVLNDWKNMFPEMKHITGLGDIAHRDIYTEKRAEALRVSALWKNGVKMWFLVNEGEETIDTEA